MLGSLTVDLADKIDINPITLVSLILGIAVILPLFLRETLYVVQGKDENQIN